MPEHWRLIVDPPRVGAANMAADEAALAAVARGAAAATVRLYRWAPAAVSLGYFQPAAEAAGRVPAGADLVRRLTGGGAILHDAELTYSLCVPAGHRLARGAGTLYRAAHEAILAALGELGVAAGFRAEADAETRGRGDAETAAPPRRSGPGHVAAQRGPFFCFSRHDPNDIVCRVGGRALKIAGSAQRRLAEAVLQHGSILLAPPAAGARAEGATDVAAMLGRPADLDRLIAALAASLAERLGAELRPGERSAAERAEADRLAVEKYAADAWTRRR